jgi:hypothetical protein
MGAPLSSETTSFSLLATPADLNIYQRQVLELYHDGDFLHLLDVEEFDYYDLGDTLLTFILTELITEDGDETPADYTDRLQTGMLDLEVALRAVENLQDAMVVANNTANALQA